MNEHASTIEHLEMNPGEECSVNCSLKGQGHDFGQILVAY